MKKILILLTATIIFTSCGPQIGDGTNPLPKEKKDGYNIIVIDSCQYIEVDQNAGFNSAVYSLTHKGNCNNPIHASKERN